MKIRRFASLATSVQFTPDQAVGKWCLYEDVKPLLKRIEELERDYNGDVVLLLERIKELEEQLEFERSLGDWM